VAAERDQQMQAELDQAETRLAEAEAELRRGQQQVSSAKDQLAVFVVNSYQYGDPTLTSLGAVLNGGSTSDLSQRLSLVDSIAGAQSASLDRLTAAETLLEIRRQQVTEIRDEVAARRADAAANLQLKQELEAAAERQTAAVRSLVEDRRSAKIRADRAKQADLRQIAQLERERNRIQDMLQRLARRDPGPTISVPEPGGFLDMPIPGAYITSSYGMRMHPILHVLRLHDGTDFGAACGTPVYASAAGTVVSEYYDGGYGNRIIVSHGRVNGVSLATSYNHLESFVAGIGTQVERGQLIGYSGTTGYSTGCHLHFMVYENGVAVDPMGWL
jgi:murein DD-endopeptidase MepM/ murein hydrolase activator NlpD